MSQVKNRLESYIDQIEKQEKEKSRKKLRTLSGLLLALVVAACCWGYFQLPEENFLTRSIAKMKEVKEESPAVVPTEKTDIQPEETTVELDLPEIEEKETEKSALPLPGLKIQGDFVVGQPIEFVVTGNSNKQKCELDFGDGQSMALSNYTKHIYSTPGEFLVKFTAGDEKSNIVKIKIDKRIQPADDDFKDEIVKIENNKKLKVTENGNVDVPADFPGGAKALTAFLQTRTGSFKDIEGRIVIGFDVNANGKTQNLKILDGIDQETDKAIINALSDMPNWLPAKKNGQKIDSKYRLPLYFKRKA